MSGNLNPWSPLWISAYSHIQASTWAQIVLWLVWSSLPSLLHLFLSILQLYLLQEAFSNTCSLYWFLLCRPPIAFVPVSLIPHLIILGFLWYTYMFHYIVCFWSVTVLTILYWSYHLIISIWNYNFAHFVRFREVK